MFNFIKKLFKGKKSPEQSENKSSKVSPISKNEVKPEAKAQTAPSPKRKVITEVKLSAVAEAKQQESVSGKFCVKIANDGTYMFNLKASNGEIIATSQTYTTKSSCMKGIESVKTMLPKRVLKIKPLKTTMCVSTPNSRYSRIQAERSGSILKPQMEISLRYHRVTPQKEAVVRALKA